MNAQQPSEQARVAKLCKSFIKSMGYDCRARSDSFSMGDSVDVDVKNIPPDDLEKIKSELGQYKYGHFNGMEDIYEYSNRRDDIPQTKYLSIHCEYSEELRQKAWDYIRANLSEAADGPESFQDAHQVRIGNQWGSDLIWRVLNGSDPWMGEEFWQIHAKDYKPASKKAKAPARDGGPARIEEHEHTKHGFTMYLVIPGDRLDREDFKALRDAAKEAGGWYSRQWGSTPGGFAFKERDAAEAFKAEHFDGQAPDPGPTKPKPIRNKADKLRKLADSCQGAIDKGLADRLTNTAKRIKQAAQARQEAHHWQRVQAVALKLADLHDAGQCPDMLAGIDTKKALCHHMASEKELTGENGFHCYHVETGKPRRDDPATLALWALLNGDEIDTKAEQLKQKIDSLHGSSIAGFFPTPGPVAERVAEIANIEAGESVLEPSAGIGSLADVVPRETSLTLVERAPSLCEILRLKGYTVEQGDFLEADPGQGEFDCVIMNPPFENGQDMDHVQRAFDFLKAGGRLVAIMSPSFTYNSRAKGEKFRAWLSGLVWEREELPEGSFKESGTGVNAVIVTIRKEAI